VSESTLLDDRFATFRDGAHVATTMIDGAP
jgi:hypothetical protein